MKLFSAYVFFRYKEKPYIFNCKLNVFQRVPEEHGALYEAFSGTEVNTCWDEHEVPTGLLKQDLFIRTGELETTLLEDVGEDYFARTNYKKRIKLVFEVTNSCNLACKYCYYGGKYHGFKRLGHQVMTREQVERIAADIGPVLRNKQLALGLYGGEPLIAPDVIEFILGEITSKYDVAYTTMTTNLTLLDERAIQIVNKYDVHVHVSFDGHQFAHDFNRIRRSGEGTFDLVYRNLQTLYERIDKRRNITIACMLTPATDFAALEDSFHNDPLLRKFRDSVSFSFAMSYDNDMLRSVYSQELRDHFFDQLDGHDRDLASGNVNINRVSLFQRSRHRLHKLYQNYGQHDYEYYGFYGFCFPANVQVFASVDGRYYPCHMLNFDIEDLVIGRVGQGIDRDKCMSLLKKSLSVANQYCSSCWAAGYCARCLAAITDPARGVIGSPERMERLCSSGRYNVRKLLSTFLILHEEGKLEYLLSVK